MKKNYLILILLIVTHLLFACSDSNDDKQDPDPDPGPSLPELTDYISAAQITNKDGASATIDNAKKTITVKLVRNEEKSNVKIKLTLAKNVSMETPKELEAEYDLTSLQGGIWLSYDNKIIKYSFKTEDIIVEDIDPTSVGWTETTEFGSLPDGIKIYKSPAQYNGKNIKAFIATVDINAGRKFRIYGSTESAGGKTPDQIYAETKYPIVMNGGYFYYSSSTYKLHHIGLLVQNGSVRQGNASSSTRPNTKGVDAVYYPTRAIFGLTKGGSFISTWAYTIDGNKTYGYPQPSPIKPGTKINNVITNGETDPLPAPSSTYPEGGWELKLNDAIGAGPLLLRKGTIYNTWWEEVWDEQGGTNALYNVQRSAIGVDKNKKLILFVAEGRNTTSGIPGVTTREVAEMLKELGCTDAMNLDGGGSVCMLVNGKKTIIPNGGAATQRAVVTAIGID